jgi:uncharacterized protein involved in exopolysaccharide biosynthesis
VTKQGHSSGHTRAGGTGAGTAAGTRLEHGTDDERPFAEVRRFLHDALRILLLHRWTFFIPFCLVASLVFVLSLSMPRTYKATAHFERRSDPVALDLRTSPGAASFNYFRATMVGDLKSEEHMVEVVDNLGLTQDFERAASGELTQGSVHRRAALARSLASRLRIWANSPDQHIDQVEITYVGPDPDIGRRLVDEVRQTYARRSKRWIHESLLAQHDYFARQLAEANEELRQARQAETRLRLENPLVDPTDPGEIARKLSQLERERKELRLRKREHEADLAALRQVLASVDPYGSGVAHPSEEEADAPESPPASPHTVRISEEIRRIDAEIDRLRSTRGMTLLHPEIVELAEQRGVLESVLQREEAAGDERRVAEVPIVGTVRRDPVDIRSPEYQWEMERARTVVRIAALEDKLRDLAADMTATDLSIRELLDVKQNIFQKQEEFAGVADRVANARKRYTQLEATLASIVPAVEAAEQDRLVKFTPGTQVHASSLPVSPKANNIIILSLVIGIAAGVLFVVLAEVLDHVYRSSGQVARSLGLPILEAVDVIVTARDRRRHFVNRLVVTPLIVGLGLTLALTSGSMAYLSLNRPSTYQRLLGVPKAAVEFFAGETSSGATDPTNIS